MEFISATELFETIHEHLSALQDCCRDLSEAVSTYYFTVTPYFEWSDTRHTVDEGETDEKTTELSQGPVLDKESV